MDVTNRFVLDYAVRHGGRVLDYGCGAGAVVAAGLAAGLDIRGADVFYAGSNAREEAERSGLLGGSIVEMDDGRIPFPDATFDLVVNNQVMEHVEDLEATLAEIRRVLAPGGSVLSIFPSRDVWREGHIGIPFAHWFRKGSRVRFAYTLTLRGLGFGYWKEQAPTRRRWAADKLEWLDTYTRYRSREEILAAYGRWFTNEFREVEYIRYRLRDKPWRAFLARLLDVPGAQPLATALFRKLAFMVIVSRAK
jgi:SAM-dependent methyltransferase